jgi:hypothetical protein
MNPSDYGDVRGTTSFETFIRYFVTNNKWSYEIDISLDNLINKVRILGAIDLNWVDTKISDDVFKREIGKSVIFFMGGERVLRKKQLNAKPFRKLAVDSIINSDFVTMDIETIKFNGFQTPGLRPLL